MITIKDLLERDYSGTSRMYCLKRCSNIQVQYNVQCEKQEQELSLEQVVNTINNHFDFIEQQEIIKLAAKLNNQDVSCIRQAVRHKLDECYFLTQGRGSCKQQQEIAMLEKVIDKLGGVPNAKESRI